MNLGDGCAPADGTGGFEGGVPGWGVMPAQFP